MITVREAIELLHKCNPDAIIRIAQPEDDYSENVVFVEEVDDIEVHFCNSKPDNSCFDGNQPYSDMLDFWIEVIAEEEHFGQIKTHRAAPPKLSA